MTRRIATAASAVLLWVAAASAQVTPKAGFMPPPLGNVVQSQKVAFNGESPANQWRAIVSKELLGSDSGRDFYQWYLSIYTLQRGAYRLRYQSPRNGGPLSRVTRANGAKMWFPDQDLDIVGTAALMGPHAQQLVVASHETAADCGSATISVFASAGGTVRPVAMLTNFCDLDAKIGADHASVELTGPYYAAKAPLCCPTKPHVTATLRYHGGKWIASPNYFKVE